MDCNLGQARARARVRLGNGSITERALTINQVVVLSVSLFTGIPVNKLPLHSEFFPCTNSGHELPLHSGSPVCRPSGGNKR